MTLQRKLLLASAVGVVTTIGLGLYTIRSISTMSALMTTTYDNALMASTFSKSAQAAFIKSDRAMKDAVTAPNLKELRRAIAVADESEKTFLEDLDVVKERALSKESGAVVAEIKQLYERWRPIRVRKVGAARAYLEGKRKWRTIGLRADESQIPTAVEEKLEILTDQAAEAGYLFRESSRQVGRTTLYVAYGIVVFAIIVSFGVSIVLARGMAPPLRSPGSASPSERPEVVTSRRG